MKRFLILLFITLSIILLVSKKEQKYYIIPKEAIRFRIIPNSNNVNDQYAKIKVKQNIEKEFSKDLTNSNSIKEARVNINKNINKYNNLVKDTFESINYDKEYKINYGLNHFPEKEYKGVLYEEGDYESLVITIGSGSGDNWWCVLFPPICAFEETNNKQIEYKFFIEDIINRYL